MAVMKDPTQPFTTAIIIHQPRKLRVRERSPRPCSWMQSPIESLDVFSFLFSGLEEIRRAPLVKPRRGASCRLELRASEARIK